MVLAWPPLAPRAGCAWHETVVVRTGVGGRLVQRGLGAYAQARPRPTRLQNHLVRPGKMLLYLLYFVNTVFTL